MEDELLEFIILPDATNGDNDSYRWTHGDTLIFLSLYETYRKKVGSLQIKSLKKMYEEISKELRLKTKKNISPGHCENRWKVLERAYKKYILNNNKTGSGRKDFEYADVMSNILGKKKNIHPEIVLSSETVDTTLIDNPEDINQNIATSSNDVKDQNSSNTSNVKVSKVTHPSRTKYNNRTLKCQLLKDIRLDRQRYYDKRHKQENQKIEEKLKKNNLLKERNDILRELVNRFPITNLFQD
ncbi:hypothetical protein ABEB36_010816 [Hypothenemus hampei]|uniref:Myb/SANT-like DNA-binding domain-containing protein n=1 Tax=Hypothenemus hampei TaxID=57062 RepID=A0ABD1ED50_HYPHA